MTIVPSQDVISSLPGFLQHEPNDYSPVGDVWSDETKHLLSGLGDSNKDTVVDLQQSEELQDLSGLGGDLGDTVCRSWLAKWREQGNRKRLTP
jgi:hypothetical protein